MTKYPRLLNTDLTIKEILHPISLSITETMVPLSTASITLPKGEFLPSRGYVELFTPLGSAGIFRVRSPRDAYGNDTTTAELEHAITEVGDYLVKDEYDEMVSATDAMKKIWKHYKGKSWKLGNCTALGTGKIALDESYSRVLDAMLAILEQKPECMMTFNFNTKPWTVSIAKKSTVVDAEGRLARNVSSATVTYDDTELCTRLYYQTFNSKKVGTWTHKDADTIKKYGVVEREISTSSDMSTTEINATVNTYIKEHRIPRVTISIEAEELSQITGETFDKFKVGKLFRLTIPEDGLNISNNITEVAWADVFNDPRNVTVTLGDQEDTVVTYLHNLESSGSGGGGGSGKKKKGDDEYKSKWDVQDSYIKGYVKKIDKQGNILEQAGLDLNSKGVLIYAKTKNGLQSKIDLTANSIRQEVKNVKKGLESSISITEKGIRQEVKSAKENLQASINVEKNRISLVVEGTGKNAKIKPASIVASINDSQSEIKISADHIVLDGLVTASELQTQKGRIDNLITGKTTATSLVSTDMQAVVSFYFKNHSINSYPVTTSGGRAIYALGYLA